MRAFIVACMAVAACAEILGYNYRPVEYSNVGLSFSPGNYGSSSNPALALAPQGDFYTATNEAPSYASEPEYEKEFFTYTANEDDFKNPDGSNQYENSAKQGIRVVFIKGPENQKLEHAAVSLAQHAADHKTDIYILQKQNDLANLANKLNIVNENNNNKPEVHFVKYRTPEDAANAQNAIQSQYDSLGGPSQSHDGGIAPAFDFAASAPVSSASNSYLPPAPVADEPNNSYLPSSILRLFRL